jgi:hypothetical protein
MVHIKMYSHVLISIKITVPRSAEHKLIQGFFFLLDRHGRCSSILYPLNLPSPALLPQVPTAASSTQGLSSSSNVVLLSTPPLLKLVPAEDCFVPQRR